MIWSKEELDFLKREIVNRIVDDIIENNSKNILVLCSGDGSIVFEIAKKLSQQKVNWRITGLEADRECWK